MCGSRKHACAAAASIRLQSAAICEWCSRGRAGGAEGAERSGPLPPPTTTRPQPLLQAGSSPSWSRSRPSGGARRASSAAWPASRPSTWGCPTASRRWWGRRRALSLPSFFLPFASFCGGCPAASRRWWGRLCLFLFPFSLSCFSAAGGVGAVLRRHATGGAQGLARGLAQGSACAPRQLSLPQPADLARVPPRAPRPHQLPPAPATKLVCSLPLPPLEWRAPPTPAS